MFLAARAASRRSGDAKRRCERLQRAALLFRATIWNGRSSSRVVWASAFLFCAAMARSAPKPAPKSIPEKAQTESRRTTGNLTRVQG